MSAKTARTGKIEVALQDNTLVVGVRSRVVAMATRRRLTGAVSAPQEADHGLPPVPPEEELNRLLDGVLETMNIPQAKAREFMAESSEKKWRLVCSTRQALCGPCGGGSWDAVAVATGDPRFPPRRGGADQGET